MAGQEERTHRLQVHLSKDEQRAIEDFRFREHFPSRSAAVRELLQRGLLTDEREETSKLPN
jgi:Arc/MetJ-type ribon-helix-helix transcriptional regulator